MKQISVLEAQEALQKWVELTREEPIILTQNGENPVAVLLSIDEFRSMQAMLDLASDPDRLEEIYNLHEHVQKGQVEDFGELA